MSYTVRVNGVDYSGVSKVELKTPEGEPVLFQAGGGKTLYMDAALLNAGGVYPVDADDYTTAVIPAEATFVDVEAFVSLPNIDTVIINGECEFEFHTEYNSETKFSTTYSPISYAGLPIRKVVAANRESGFPERLFKNYGINFTAEISCVGIINDAFNNCVNLREADLTGTTGVIGSFAFGSCKRLERIVIPDGITGIGSYAFSYCTKLEEVTLPESLTYMDSYAFKSCGLRAIVIPKSLKSINTSVFENCSLLESVTLHEELDAIMDYAFDNCTSLASITIPSSNTTLGMNDGQVFPSSTVIRGHAGSTAEAYATKWGNPFEVIA